MNALLRLIYVPTAASERELLQYQLHQVHEHAQLEDRHKRARIRWELAVEDRRRAALGGVR
jgi:hypothetical protein